jgi:hypothetical protein
LKFRQQDVTDNFTIVIGHQLQDGITRISQRVDEVGFHRLIERGDDHVPDSG